MTSVLISREGWLPPVIDEAQDVAHIQPDQIRTASRVWTILRPERFVGNRRAGVIGLGGLSTTATRELRAVLYRKTAHSADSGKRTRRLARRP